MTAPLSPAEQATAERFDAAEPAPESLRERVADAIYDGIVNSLHVGRVSWLDAADAAIAVMRGDR